MVTPGWGEPENKVYRMAVKNLTDQVRHASPTVRAATKSCVGIEQARLPEIRRHVMHAEKLMLVEQEAETAEEKKMKHISHNASLTMMKQNADLSRRTSKGTDDRRKNGRDRKPEQDTCYICGRSGHWARHCLDKGSRRKQGSNNRGRDNYRERWKQKPTEGRRERPNEDFTQSN